MCVCAIASAGRWDAVQLGDSACRHAACRYAARRYAACALCTLQRAWCHAVSPLACCATQLKDKTKVTAFQPGQALSVAEMFKEGDFVDVAGMSIGKGFQGKAMGPLGGSTC